MASVAETRKLVDNILRLRRAEDVPSVTDDVAPVRRDLEAQLGPTLSRSRASSVLGVSQTALDRWVAAGRVPIVVTPRGRHEVPSRFTIELREAIASTEGEKTHHPLAAALAARFDAAKGIETLLPLIADDGGPAHGHRTAELRGLAYHRAIAGRLDDRLLAEGRARVDRLAAEGHMHPLYADRWREVLSLSIDEIAERITADDPDGADLRQNSPFAGVLNEQERRRIIDRVR